jgi:mannose-6-phosphate isomerase-like protein (cupin superfamily)
MTTTFIDTAACRRTGQGTSQGEVAEIVNKALCGAEDVTAMLRWLGAGERLDAAPRAATHQLIYLMEGDGVITLEGKDYEVARGAGIYLGPDESAAISHAGATPLKLLHLIVPVVDH